MTEEEKKQSSDALLPQPKSTTGPKETGKQRRQRHHDEKRSKQKTEQKYGAFKTQEQINDGKKNEQFEKMYQGLGILKEDDWKDFYAKLKEPLDICFRINSVDKHRDRTIAILKDKIAVIANDP